MDISSWLALTKYLLHECLQHIARHTEVITQDQVQSTIWKTVKDENALGHILDTADIAAPSILTCTGATKDHCTRTDIAAIEVGQDSLTPHIRDIATDPAMTHNDSHTTHITVIQTTTLGTTAEHITACQATTLKTTVDPAHNCPTTHQSTGHTRRNCAPQYHIPSSETARPNQEGT